MPLTTGQILQHRYRIVSLIGQGGFGSVYRAWDLNLNATCALKENLDTSPEAQKQFQLEANLLSRLRHLNLPRVTDHFFLPGQGQYLVMDFVDGENLDELLQERGTPFTEAELLPWMEQVCAALEYLHSRTPPIIHRDLKPQNIIITPENHVMLVDFGISKVYDPQKATSTGGRGATPGYSPPEQYGQGRTDARSDIYALGATLYTLLTGDSPPDAIDRLLQQHPLTPPRQINVSVSPSTETVILQAIELQPTNRFATIMAFRAALYSMDGWSQPAIKYAQSQAQSPVPGEQLAVPQIPQSRIQTTPAKAQSTPSQAPKPFAVLPGVNPASIEWVKIPAGEFFYSEKNERKHIGKSFKISKYPVTNAQYKQFLDANPQYRVPNDWDKQRREYPPGKANHPVVFVSWDDAQAFCHWANCRLPSEEEWEKAARGTSGRTYPWGNDWTPGKYCNSAEARIGDTTPVDHFPKGISPYGVWDMSGNVWEWTNSNYDEEKMVLRGGAWYVSAQGAHATYRGNLAPTFLSHYTGFRCARE